MKMSLQLVALCTLAPLWTLAQVGIGTTTPKAFFNVAPGRTVLFGQDSSQVGSENKLIWYASLGAFRVGGVEDNSWSRSSPTDNTNVGRYSFASGHNTKASGGASTALGEFNIASGGASTALGNGNTASGLISTAFGSNNTASGSISTAFGNLNTASGELSTAIGNSVIASGPYSTAIGSNANTNQKRGSFIIGDYTVNTVVVNDAPNQMMMRFTGGYKLFTNSSASIGVSLSSGGNAWSVISDSTRKENFRPADGASFLQKISTMRLGTWNYKGQDARQYRHYGPMAQEFFSAFGRDELGVIGEDKSINQADFDGVNLIAIQALIKKVEQLEADNKRLRQQNTTLKTETQARLDKVEAALQRQSTSQDLTLKP